MRHTDKTSKTGFSEISNGELTRRQKLDRLLVHCHQTPPKKAKGRSGLSLPEFNLPSAYR
jgi:hypothetical protein